MVNLSRKITETFVTEEKMYTSKDVYDLLIDNKIEKDVAASVKQELDDKHKASLKASTVIKEVEALLPKDDVKKLVAILSNNECEEQVKESLVNVNESYYINVNDEFVKSTFIRIDEAKEVNEIDKYVFVLESGEEKWLQKCELGRFTRTVSMIQESLSKQSSESYDIIESALINSGIGDAYVKNIVSTATNESLSVESIIRLASDYLTPKQLRKVKSKILENMSNIKSLSEHITESFVDVNEAKETTFKVGDKLQHKVYDGITGKVMYGPATLADCQRKGYDGDEENFEDKNPKDKVFYGFKSDDDQTEYIITSTEFDKK